MDKRDFYDRVRESSDVLDQSDAEFVTQASLTVLGRVLPPAYAQELETLLPEGLSDFVWAVSDLDQEAKWARDEFWRQISIRSAITDPRRVKVGFWAVIDTLRESVGDEKVERWTAHLPDGVSRETERR